MRNLLHTGWHRRLKLTCLSIYAMMLAGQPLYAQQRTTQEYQVKAVFLYNFTKFIDWPSTAFKDADDPFIIGIIGEDPFGSYLDETVAGEKFGPHPIQVKRFNLISEVTGCHMLYIGSDDAGFAKNILAEVSDRSILTVSDSPNFYNWDGMVRFYTENHKIRLQINVEISRAADLNISSKLLNVAKRN